MFIETYYIRKVIPNVYLYFSDYRNLLYACFYQSYVLNIVLTEYILLVMQAKIVCSLHSSSYLSYSIYDILFFRNIGIFFKE